jgi:ElaB/YqjD/DUF883 family membrane-anchored ribosome-binding protein
MPQSNTPHDGNTQAGAAGSSDKAGGQGGSRDVPSHSAATSATAGNDSLQEQLRTLRSDIAQISTTVAQLVQGQGGSLKEVAAGAVGAARERVAGITEQGRHYADQAQTQMAAMAREIESQIERNPMTAVLVALGIGFAVGLMSRGSR